jgi:hypothetical protein
MSIFCINIPDVGLSQTETCSFFVTHWMKCTVHVVSDCYIQHLKISLYPESMLRQSLRVSKRPQRTVLRALIYTMFISTDYTPVTCFIFYSSARSLQPLVPFKGLFRWRLQSRITSL